MRAAWARAAVVGLALASQVVTAPVAASAEPDPVPTTRVAGADRYETAARLALRGRESAERVWVATGEDYPDALAAGATGEPVVLVRPDGVPDVARAALRELAPEVVVAVGGRRVLADATLAAAGRAASASTDRVAGADRVATAVALSRRLHPDGAEVVWLATGWSFADALAAGPVAAVEDAPVLLVGPDHLPDVVARELERLAPHELVVVGGPAAVDEEVARRAAAAAGVEDVTRVAGPDRYATAAAVADRGVDRHELRAHAVVATGERFPDALAAGPVATALGGTLVLATHGAVPEPTRRLLLDVSAPAQTLAGGEQALSRTVFHRASRPWLVGACDLYDVPDSTPIQGHPENQRPELDAWSGPWVIDDFRGAWGMAVPARWRQDKVESLEHRGVLFYVDTMDGYTHRLSVTVLCGNPFLMGGGVVLDADDPAQIAARGPHQSLPPPTEERFDGPALYTAIWHGDQQAQRYDYVAVDDDVILIHYLAENQYARDLPGRIGDVADRIAASVAHLGEVACPPNASSCSSR